MRLGDRALAVMAVLFLACPGILSAAERPATSARRSAASWERPNAAGWVMWRSRKWHDENELTQLALAVPSSTRGMPAPSTSLRTPPHSGSQARPRIPQLVAPPPAEPARTEEHATPPARATASPRPTATVPFALGPGDGMTITVWGYPELSVETIVLPDGTISLPLLGALPAAGLTAAGLSEQIADALTQQVLDPPNVTVIVTTLRSRTFSVLGEVGTPGIFPLWGERINVLEALAQAGGVGPRALPHQVRLVRAAASGVRESLPLDLADLVEHPETDPTLQPGDLLFVPGQDVRRKVCVLGEVAIPGLYALSDGMTVVEALTAAGWTTPSAALGSVMVARRSSGDRKTFFRVNAVRVVKKQDWSQDLTLQPGDIVYVPAHFFASVANYVRFFTSNVEPTAATYLRVYDASNPASYIVTR